MAHSISDLNLNTSSIVNSAQDEDVILTNHRRPVAVIISYERYQALLNDLESPKKVLTLADLRASLALVDEVPLAERPETVHKPIDF